MEELSEKFTPAEKIDISKKIKDIPFSKVEDEFAELQKIGICDSACHMSARSRVGNSVVDYFTFTQRLETRGKYNINYFEFISNMDFFTKKKFIANMLLYYETVKNKKKKKNNCIVLKEVYNICISAINIIRPLVYMEIYGKYKPQCILDFCAGWGGALVAASALNVEKYIGIEINHSLTEPYHKLSEYLKTKSTTVSEMYFQDALKMDYSKLKYDFVFTSPPYYFIQKYQNNTIYESKDEMDKTFYFPLFNETYKHLSPGGRYILNINKEVYENVCLKLFGPADDTYPYKKSKRQNDYQEIVYVWNKKS